MSVVMGKKKPKTGRPPGHPSTNVGVRYPDYLLEKFDAEVAKARRSRTTELIIAMEEYLAKRGHDITPPKGAKEDKGN